MSPIGIPVALQFGVGAVYCLPNGGNIASPNTPANLQTIQDVDITFEQKLEELRGQHIDPDDVAPSDRSVKFKAAFAGMPIDIFNALMMGETIVTGLNETPSNQEAHTVPVAGSPATWTMTHAYTKGQVISDGTNLEVCTTAGTSGGTTPSWAVTFGATTVDGSVVWTLLAVVGSSTISVTNVAFWLYDAGVSYANTGNLLQPVSSLTLVQGEYAVIGGVYAFASTDVAAAVQISYLWVDSTTGRTMTVGSHIQGWGPTYSMFVWEDYQNFGNGLYLYRCRTSKMGKPYKRAGYVITPFEGTAYLDISRSKLLDMMEGSY